MIDADFLIAGVLTPEGATTEILDEWLSGAFELVVCPQLIHEVTKALLHPRIARKYAIAEEDVKALAARLSEEGVMMDDPQDPPRVVSQDPGDDYLVALAQEATADCLVTRDHHFEGVKVEGIPILAPRSFLDTLLG